MDWRKGRESKDADTRPRTHKDKMLCHVLWSCRRVATSVADDRRAVEVVVLDDDDNQGRRASAGSSPVCRWLRSATRTRCRPSASSPRHLPLSTASLSPRCRIIHTIRLRAAGGPRILGHPPRRDRSPLMLYVGDMSQQALVSPTLRLLRAALPRPTHPEPRGAPHLLPLHLRLRLYIHLHLPPGAAAATAAALATARA